MKAKHPSLWQKSVYQLVLWVSSDTESCCFNLGNIHSKTGDFSPQWKNLLVSLHEVVVASKSGHANKKCALVKTLSVSKPGTKKVIPKCRSSLTTWTGPSQHEPIYHLQDIHTNLDVHLCGKTPGQNDDLLLHGTLMLKPQSITLASMPGSKQESIRGKHKALEYEHGPCTSKSDLDKYPWALTQGVPDNSQIVQHKS